MTIEVLDPSWEDGSAQEFSRADRPSALEGLTVGVISNGKENTKPFFDLVADALVRDHGVAKVVRRVKANYSAPAEAHIIDEARNWDVTITGIGD